MDGLLIRKQLFAIAFIVFSFFVSGCTSGTVLIPPDKIEEKMYKSSVTKGTFFPRTPASREGKELIKEADRFCRAMQKNFVFQKIDILRSRDKKISRIDLYFNCSATVESKHRRDRKKAERFFDDSSGGYLPDTSLLNKN